MEVLDDVHMKRPEREQATMADIFSGDFARLVPRNHIAQRLFSATCIYIEENKTFDLRFLQRNNAGSEMPTALDQPVESSTDYDSQLEGENEGSQMEDLGYFVLSLNQDANQSFLTWAGEWVEEPENHRQIVGWTSFCQDPVINKAGRLPTYI